MERGAGDGVGVGVDCGVQGRVWGGGEPCPVGERGVGCGIDERGFIFRLERIVERASEESGEHGRRQRERERRGLWSEQVQCAEPAGRDRGRRDGVGVGHIDDVQVSWRSLGQHGVGIDWGGHGGIDDGGSVDGHGIDFRAGGIERGELWRPEHDGGRGGAWSERVQQPGAGRGDWSSGDGVGIGHVGDVQGGDGGMGQLGCGDDEWGESRVDERCWIVRRGDGVECPGREPWRDGGREHERERRGLWDEPILCESTRGDDGGAGDGVVVGHEPGWEGGDGDGGEPSARGVVWCGCGVGVWCGVVRWRRAVGDRWVEPGDDGGQQRVSERDGLRDEQIQRKRTSWKERGAGDFVVL